MVWHDDQLGPARRTAVARAGEVSHVAQVMSAPGWPAKTDAHAARTPGLTDTGTLLSAGLAALSLGLSRVVWPVHLGGHGGAESAGAESETAIHGPQIDAIADAYDRAMLAARLLSIDAARDGCGAITIETPYIDFTDTDLLDLAADLDAPLSAVWWCARDEDASGAAGCGRCIECRRWDAAAKGLGYESLDSLGVPSGVAR